MISFVYETFDAPAVPLSQVASAFSWNKPPAYLEGANQALERVNSG